MQRLYSLSSLSQIANRRCAFAAGGRHQAGHYTATKKCYMQKKNPHYSVRVFLLLAMSQHITYPNLSLPNWGRALLCAQSRGWGRWGFQHADSPRL